MNINNYQKYNEINYIRNKLMKFSNTGIYRYNFDGKILFMDSALLNILEINDLYDSPEKVIGKNINDLFIKVSDDISIRKNIIKNKQIKNFEYQFKTLNGKLKWSLHDCQLIENKNTGETYIEVIARDITELKNTELKLENTIQELNIYKNHLESLVKKRTRNLEYEIEKHRLTQEKLLKSEEQFRNITETSNDTIVQFNREGKITFINKAGSSLTGYSHKELLQKKMTDFLLPEAKQKTIKLFEQVLSGKPIQEEVILLTKNKTQKNVNYSSVPLYYKNKIIGITSIVRDITELKKLHSQLIQSEKMAAIGQLSAGISHEFNNILTIIKLNCTTPLLKNSKSIIKLDKETLTNFSTIDFQVDEAKKIIQNILEFSKPKKNKIEKIKIQKVIDSVCILEEKYFNINNIKLEKEYNFNPEIYIDITQIKQVFLNLLINASHAIISKDINNGKIKISVNQNNNYVEIKVHDNGIGIKKEKIKKIFNPFYTTKGALSKKEIDIKGTGLGLSVAYSIIKNHNGKIAIKSEYNKYTEFTILLPLYEKNKKDTEYTNNKEKNITDKKNITETNIFERKILIIDDEVRVTDLFKEILEMYNFKNVTAINSPQKVLYTFKKDMFNIIFIDALMPGLNGPELARELKQIDSEIKIVFVTGKQNLILNDDSLINCRIIHKPFKITEITECLGLTL